MKIRDLPRLSGCAFTLTEIAVTVALLGMAAAVTLWSLNMSNKQASTARLFTAATATVQNQIELAQTVGPFVPQAANPLIPESLQLGQFAKSNVPVYKDPVNGNVLVTGDLLTTVSDMGVPYNGQNLNTRVISIKLTYLFRGHRYSVKMGTLRTSDL